MIKTVTSHSALWCAAFTTAIAIAVIAPAGGSSTLSSTLHAEKWAGFQNGGKLSFNAIAELPVKWTDTSGVAWKTPLAGYGQSSPVVEGDVIYVTSTSGKMKEKLHIQAFDKADGKERWKYEAENASPHENTSYVSRAAPTPVCDQNGVIAFFEGGNVIAMDPAGKLRWSRNLAKDEGGVTARHGLSASLEQNGKYVFTWVEREKQPYVVALNKTSGKTAWKSDGLGVTSWSSPRLVPISSSEKHLVLSGIGKLMGLDPETGKKLWSFDGISGNSTPTPVPLGEGRFLIGATVGRGEAGGGKAAASNGVIQISGKPGSYKAAYVWQAKRATCSFGSPLAHDGFAYFVNRSGVVYCLDIKTGEEQYAKRAGSSVWATPLGAGGHVYLFGKDGGTTVIQSGGEFKKLASNLLWKPAAEGGGRSGSPVLYAAAIVGSDFIIRRGDMLYCVTSQKAP